MNADQIREQWNQSMLEHLQAEDLPFAVAGILVEIAAQLAEMNVHKILQGGTCAVAGCSSAWKSQREDGSFVCEEHK